MQDHQDHDQDHQTHRCCKIAYGFRSNSPKQGLLFVRHLGKVVGRLLEGVGEFVASFSWRFGRHVWRCVRCLFGVSWEVFWKLYAQTLILVCLLLVNLISCLVITWQGGGVTIWKFYRIIPLCPLASYTY